MQPAINTPGRRTAASSVRDTVTLGVLLFAPVLLIFPLALVGEAFGWVAGITLGWLLGLALLWSSTSFTPREKILASLVWPGGLAPAFLLATATGEVCVQTAGSAEVCTGSVLPAWVGIPMLIVSVAAPIVVAVILMHRSNARRSATTGTPPAVR